MEEDIKILKELTEEYNSQHYMDMPLINGKQIQALENLLKGYRELEAENRGLRLDRRNLSNCIEAIKHTTPLNMVSNTDYYIQINDNYIPKSKVKEKIEQLDYRCNSNLERAYKKEILQEIMESK